MTRFLIVLFLLSFSITGCGNSTNSGNNANGPAVKTEEDIPARSPNVEYADNWSEVTIVANFAKTQVTPVAHFNTSRNACGKPAYGPIDLEAWNGFAKNLNKALADLNVTPAAEDYCVPSPDPDANGYMPKYLDGTLDIKFSSGTSPVEKTVTLFENKDNQVCSKIKDHTLSDRLLKFINQIILAADKEDCPNGWGSALR